MNTLSRHTVLVLQTALRLLKHGEGYRALVHPGIDVDAAIAELGEHYDENGGCTDAARYVECPECHAEVAAD